MEAAIEKVFWLTKSIQFQEFIALDRQSVAVLYCLHGGDMALSFYEAKQRLLSGQPLTWAKFGDHKAGSVHLASAGARRLFHFLLTCEQSKVADAHESLFDDLIAAWELETFEPATETEQSGTPTNAGPWRLAKLETSGFGGLNQVGGPVFSVPFDGANWCLEGQNGSGKTSLASAIIWAMTGCQRRYKKGPATGLKVGQSIQTKSLSLRLGLIGVGEAAVA